MNIQIPDSTSVSNLTKVAGILFKSHNTKGQIILAGFSFCVAQIEDSCTGQHAGQQAADNFWREIDWPHHSSVPFIFFCPHVQQCVKSNKTMFTLALKGQLNPSVQHSFCSHEF